MGGGEDLFAILIGITLNFYIILEIMDIFMILSYSIQEHEISTRLLKSVFVWGPFEFGWTTWVGRLGD